MPFGSGRTWQWNWDVASGSAGRRTESDPRSTSGEGAGAGRFWTKVCRPNPALGGRNILLDGGGLDIICRMVLSSPSGRRIGLARKGNIPSLLLVFAATWML